MIGLNNSPKMKKSKKPLVHIFVAEERNGYEDSDTEEAGTDSPNEEVNSRENFSAPELSSSGAEDQLDTSEDADEIQDKSKANPGWADAMKKILSTNKPKNKKSVVLSKAKKLNEIISKPKEEVLSFELEGKDGEIKKETIKVEETVNNECLKTAEQRKRRRKDTLGIRIKPSLLDKERERRLQKIATNGVVQLFNAVKQQQKEIEKKLVEAGPLERKREKALKSIDRKSFLDMLMGGTNKLTEDVNKEELKDEKEETEDDDDSNKKNDKVWSVLRDDFVMGAKLKDWNKQNTDEESSAPEEMDSD